MAAANREGNFQWPIYVGKTLALHHNKCAEQRFFRESSVPGCRAGQCEVHAAKDSVKEVYYEKVSCLLMALGMCLNLCIPAFAAERARIEIIVENEAEIAEFLNSQEYDPDNLYSFIIPDQRQLRMLCPSCGSNSYRGVTEHREMDIHPRMCPSSPDTQNDVCTEFDVYTYSKCDYFGYKASAAFLDRYWVVECHAEAWDGVHM